MEYFNIKVFVSEDYDDMWMLPENLEYSMAYTNEILLEDETVKHTYVFKLRYGSN